MSAVALNTLKKAAVLDLKKGNLDKAVEKLQKLVRISTVSGSSDAAASTIPLWLLLGESYKQKSNYASAIRVFQSVLEIESNVSARLQLIELCRVVGRLESSVEAARILKDEGNCPENLKIFFLTSYAYSLVLYAQSFKSFDDQMLLLEEVFPLLELLAKSAESISYQKSLAIALEIVQGVSSEMFADVCQKLNLSKFGINNQLELVEKRVTALTTILNGNLTFSDSWSDLSLCLSELASLSGDEATHNKAEEFMKRAILLPSSIQKRSNYYVNMGILQVKRLRLARAGHCFIRAIKLNDQNATAWFALSLVYKMVDKRTESFKARMNAQQIDPDVVEC